MKTVQFTIEDPDMALLPRTLASSSLTLEEIGALFCLLSIGGASDEYLDSIDDRMKSAETVSVLKSLKDRGVWDVKSDGNTMTFEIKTQNIPPLLVHHS
jgi:hypothetical protein